MATSSQILTDAQSAITTGPSAATIAKANAAAGPITDVPGMLIKLRDQAKELKQLTNYILAAMDAADGIKGTIQNIHDTFV
jgi:hypothetical protein